MPTYEYVGKNRLGKIVKGLKVAPNIEEAKRMIMREQIAIHSIKEKKGAFLKGLNIFKKKIATIKELSLFARQLATLLEAGISFIQAMDILAKQTENKRFQEVLTTVKNDIEAGMAVEEAFRKHPEVFSELFTNMVAAGEKSGNLPEILNRLAKYLESEARIKAKVKSAMTYPAVVITVAVVIVVIIMYKVIPAFENIFSDLGAELPVPTQIVVGISHFLIDNALIIFLIAVGIFALLRGYYSTYKGKRVIDGFMLRIKVLGDLLLKSAVARFSRTLSTLLASAIDLLAGIEITAKTAGNAVIEDHLLEAKNLVAQGKNLSDVIENIPLFPPMLSQMIRVGESTGSIDEMLSKVADFYEEEVERAVETLISLIEPFMIVFLGIVIGGIIVSMYLPMFSIIGKIGG